MCVFIRFAVENSSELGGLWLLWCYEFNIQSVQIGGTIDELVLCSCMLPVHCAEFPSLSKRKLFWQT